MKIIKLKEIDSTNDFCKKFIDEGELIVTAEKQTCGKGTKGRSFISDVGGLYVSVMRRYEHFDYTKTFSIMINACVAVCKTVEAFGLKPCVKWANDVLLGGKKVCGTLIENRLGANGMCTSIVGIGLNVNNVLPEELKDIATTMCEQKGKRLSLLSVRAKLLHNLQSEFTVADYKSRVDWFGKEVYLTSGEEQVKATAVDVDDCGNLICDISGERRKISSGEMSLRLI